MRITRSLELRAFPHTLPLLLPPAALLPLLLAHAGNQPTLLRIVHGPLQASLFSALALVLLLARHDIHAHEEAIRYDGVHGRRTAGTLQ